MLGGFLWLHISAFRERIREHACVEHLRRISMAIYLYAKEYDKFPPSFSAASDGKPLHSWRVLILPYMGFADLYQSIRLHEEWGSDYNKQFHDKMPADFSCPACTATASKQYTNYCMILNKQALGNTDGYTLNDIIGVNSKFIVLVERQMPICWMYPVDILQSDALLGVNKLDQGIGSNHKAGANAILSDFSSHTMPKNIDKKKLKSMLSAK
ncbi:MAG: DUF1559 domain-containing protein [Planctomycetaceae bacterium]|nr:DUF1559 domain-containing protein [Planctomycetaceae bacterium]